MNVESTAQRARRTMGTNEQTGFEATETIDITPTPEGQEAILATSAASILSDVRKARRESDVELLKGIVGLAFGLGYNAGTTARKPEGRIDPIALRERLEDRIR